MPDPAEPADLALVDALEGVWASIGALGDTLTEDEWKRPTECPGWTVQDNLAHVLGIESVILGRPVPDRSPPEGPHLKNDLARSNELWVDASRDRSGAAVLAEFRPVTDERLRALRAPGLDFGAESWTPVGPGTVRDLLPFRVFDSWIHEQDVRRAVGKPGGWAGPAAEAAIDRLAAVMPMIVGKKVAPPEGTTVVFVVTGPVPREIEIGVLDGRARVLAAPPGAPTVRLELDGETFVRLGAGRGDPEAILAAGQVAFSGDADIGRRVALAMNFLF